jgi:hypothetical protein
MGTGRTLDGVSGAGTQDEDPGWGVRGGDAGQGRTPYGVSGAVPQEKGGVDGGVSGHRKRDDTEWVCQGQGQGRDDTGRRCHE